MDGDPIEAPCKATDDRRSIGVYARRTAWLIGLHALAWTLAPALARSNAPLDVIEIVYWGREWQAGYFKHPPLPSWILEVVARTFPGSDWPFYALSQLAVGVCFYAVWRLGLTFGSARRAFYGALLLEACWFYNYVSPEFNHSVCMFPLWALAVLALRRATTEGRLHHWLAFGIWIGLGLLTKYNTGALVVAALGYALSDRRRRAQWRTLGPWAAIATCTALCLPHLRWAIASGWQTLDYLADRTAPDLSPVARLVRPFAFLASGSFAALPVALVAWPLFGFRWRLRSDLRTRAQGAAKFALFLFGGPLLVYLLLSAATGAKIRHAHGAPLWILLGPTLLAVFEVRGDPRTRRFFLRFAVAVAVGWALGGIVRDVAGPILTGRASRTHFPGRALAREVRTRYREVTNAPLSIVGGEWWLAGNVGLYDPERPSVYCGGSGMNEIDSPPEFSPWTSDAAVARRGAVFLWSEERHGREIPDVLRARFPALKQATSIVLRQHSIVPTPDVRVGIAIAPPP